MQLVSFSASRKERAESAGKAECFLLLVVLLMPGTSRVQRRRLGSGIFLGKTARILLHAG
jgi:hypothetical protein